MHNFTEYDIIFYAMTLTFLVCNGHKCYTLFKTGQVKVKFLQRKGMCDIPSLVKCLWSEEYKERSQVVVCFRGIHVLDVQRTRLLVAISIYCLCK